MRPFICLIAIPLLLLSCAKRQESKAPQVNPGTLLTEHLGDAARSSDIRTYDKETLWQYIDGAAERYLELGFARLATADYLSDSLELTVDVYAFAANTGAAGLYADNFTPEERTIDIGDTGFVSEGLLLFYAGNIFVQINCYNPDPPDAELIKLARALEQNLKSN